VSIEPKPSSIVDQSTPAADLAIDEKRVRTLLRERHPDLSRLPLQRIDAGWDNAIFRLGDEPAVRLPRRGAAPKLIAHEQDWLPRSRLRFPAPILIGLPNAAYPAKQEQGKAHA